MCKLMTFSFCSRFWKSSPKYYTIIVRAVLRKHLVFGIEKKILSSCQRFVIIISSSGSISISISVGDGDGFGVLVSVSVSISICIGIFICIGIGIVIIIVDFSILF